MEKSNMTTTFKAEHCNQNNVELLFFSTLEHFTLYNYLKIPKHDVQKCV